MKVSPFPRCSGRVGSGVSKRKSVLQSLPASSGQQDQLVLGERPGAAVIDAQVRLPGEQFGLLHLGNDALLRAFRAVFRPL